MKLNSTQKDKLKLLKIKYPNHKQHVSVLKDGTAKVQCSDVTYRLDREGYFNQIKTYVTKFTKYFKILQIRKVSSKRMREGE